ncbi:unnamed protein product [Larinioides sclopetarius]|uniref:Uncharacterized protein n=1 Tax=Larinioides sclopetarius TaxID=280406 RepID=A0AAV2B6T7_9ARAC
MFPSVLGVLGQLVSMSYGVEVTFNWIQCLLMSTSADVSLATGRHFAGLLV